MLVLSIERINAIDEFATDFFTDEVAMADDLRTDAEQSSLVALIIMITTAAISLVLLVLLMRSILRPLGRLTRQSRQVHQGDLAIEPVKPSGPTDMRVVMRAFNDMVTTLQSYESQLDRLAKGDTKVDATLPGPLGDTVRRSVSQLATVTAQLHASEAAANRQARTDALTGLANRTAALERLAVIAMQARQNEQPAAPSSSSTSTGSRASTTPRATPRATASWPRSPTGYATRADGDVVARIGGDEFIVLIEQAVALDEVVALAHRLIDVVSAPCTGSSGQLFTMSASAGVAMVDGHRDPLDCVAQADTAVYHAKERGRGRVEVFDERLAHVIEDRADMALTMRHGAGRAAVLAVPAAHHRRRHQACRWAPRCSCGGTGRASARSGPRSSSPSPSARVSSWISRRGCSSRPSASSATGASTRSPRAAHGGQHLRAPHRGGQPQPAARRTVPSGRRGSRHDRPRDHRDPPRGRRRPRRRSWSTTCVAQGIKVAIDDFGTGYSSMSYLHQLTVDTLKIDQVFVAGMCDNRLDRTIVELLLRLGDSLGLKVVAEGVDSEQKLALLRELGCPMAQGFHIARPMSIDDATRWLRRQQALASSMA